MGRGAGQQASGGARRPVLYLRRGYERELQTELTVLHEHFAVLDDPQQARSGDRVLCRFSMLPFPALLEAELAAHGATLVQGVAAHSYLADMRAWYADLRGLTPETWFALDEVEGPGPFFVKGATNSIKDDWRSCYAADHTDLPRVIAGLATDPLISQQAVCVRRFVPLHTYAHHPRTGAPITEEFRCFVAGNEVLSRGYYWSDQLPRLAAAGHHPDPAAVPADFLCEVIRRVRGHADYYAVDVARSEAGEWLVVELNDATMCGLAGNDPQVLYTNLLAHLLTADTP